MKTAILEQLETIEREHDVSVLLAVESGSRAWGFESKNSDWDVRFVYVHRPQWYLRVEPQRDTIERMHGDLDLAGWELRKTLALLKRCNPALMEWLDSPFVYRADYAFLARIRTAAQDFFNPIASMYHYNHIYISHDERYLQRPDCSMKRFLYYLRGVLACRWIEQRRTLPPVPFAKLVEATVEEASLRAKIDQLLQLKKSGEEHDVSVVDHDLMTYARNLADYYNEHIESFRPELDKHHTETLDDLLYDMVMKYSSI
ncbi:MAG: nucleotidyltransferase domain-containing protein [Bacteroidales bacterium]|nr:nucleotidyltransferase domain-containing protein [Bacteroidales bacterium]